MSSTDSRAESQIAIGDCELDLDSRQLRCKGSSRPLPPKLTRVLRYLADRRNQVVLYDSFVGEFWNNAISENNAAHIAVSRLNRVLREVQNNYINVYIDTIAGSGVKLVVNSSESPPPHRQENGHTGNIPISPLPHEQTGDKPVKLLVDYPDDYPDALRGASSLWVTGLSLSRFFKEGRIDCLDNVVRKNKGVLKVIMLSPNCDVINIAKNQDVGPDTFLAGYIANIKRAYFHLRDLAESFPGKVEVRTTDYFLPFGLDAVDVEGKSGRIFVRFFPLHGPGDQPIFDLTPAHGYWYHFYQSQLEIHWKDYSALFHLGTNLCVDRATEEDAPIIRALAKKVATSKLAAKRGFLIPYTEAKYRQFARLAEHFYVLRFGGQVIGFVLAHSDQHIQRFRGEVYLHMQVIHPSPFIIVQQICTDPDPDFSRKGYGRKLYDFLFNYSGLDSTRYSKALCFIWTQNSASKKFHKKTNWKKSDEFMVKGKGQAEIWERPLHSE